VESGIAYLKDLLNRWDVLGGELPKNYVCFDMEGTGLKMAEDLIVELGNCRVIDCKAQEFESLLVDWTTTPFVDPEWLQTKLEGSHEIMKRKSGSAPKFTVEMLHKYGAAPDTALRTYVEILGQADWVAGHNIIRFDLPRLSYSVSEWLGYEFRIPEGRVLDTAALEKARQLRIEPKPDESFYNFQKRVLNSYAGKGVKYSLINHVVPLYRLDEQYGLDMSQGHTAGFDAMLVHLFIEELRELLSSYDENKKDNMGGD